VPTYPAGWLTGTIFENTKYPLREWFQVILIMCQAKKGTSCQATPTLTR
jgi:hypothetical protein